MSHPHSQQAPGGARDTAGTLKKLVGFLRPERARILWALVATAASTAAFVTGPKVLGEATNVIFAGLVGRRLPAGVPKQQVVEDLQAHGKDTFASMLNAMQVTPGQGIDYGKLAGYVLTVLVLYAAAAGLMWVAGLLIRTAVQNASWRLRDQAARTVDRLPLSYVDSVQRGDILSRVTNDVDNISQTLNQALSQLFACVLQVVGIAAMMLWLEWKLALLALVSVPLTGVLAGFLMKKAQPYFGRQWAATGEVSTVVEEAFTGGDVVRYYGLEQKFRDRFEASNEQLRQASFKSQAISMLMQPAIALVENATYVVVAVAGGLMVTSGSLSLGAVQAFMQYSREFTQPMGQLTQLLNLMQSGLASMERVFEFLDAPHTQPVQEESVEAAGGTQVKGHITFDSVNFSYTPGQPTITDLSLDVQPGQSVAIVGPTGAGKTTLVNLLMRFYELDSGRITIDGEDIAEMDPARLRSMMGMVLQDTWLMEGTIAENIAFGKLGASRDEIVAAAVATSVDPLVRTLAQGYDTPVDENLSAGEKQLITIARAFIADPAVLILDEATSSVDTRTEMLVAQAMNSLRAGRTSFIIAHRLSTIRSADLIVVMDQGNVVEMGTHEQLVQAGGMYADLYQSQF